MYVATINKLNFRGVEKREEWQCSDLTELRGWALLVVLLEWIQCAQAVVSLRMVTPGAEFRGVTLHRLYFKECIAGNVY